jgi:hypothetical protein
MAFYNDMLLTVNVSQLGEPSGGDFSWAETSVLGGGPSASYRPQSTPLGVAVVPSRDISSPVLHDTSSLPVVSPVAVTKCLDAPVSHNLQMSHSIFTPSQGMSDSLTTDPLGLGKTFQESGAHSPTFQTTTEAVPHPIPPNIPAATRSEADVSEYPSYSSESAPDVDYQASGLVELYPATRPTFQAFEDPTPPTVKDTTASAVEDRVPQPVAAPVPPIVDTTIPASEAPNPVSAEGPIIPSSGELISLVAEPAAPAEPASISATERSNSLVVEESTTHQFVSTPTHDPQPSRPRIPTVSTVVDTSNIIDILGTPGMVMEATSVAYEEEDELAVDAMLVLSPDLDTASDFELDEESHEKDENSIHTSTPEEVVATIQTNIEFDPSPDSSIFTIPPPMIRRLPRDSTLSQEHLPSERCTQGIYEVTEEESLSAEPNIRRRVTQPPDSRSVLRIHPPTVAGLDSLVL